jgi:hypothetical protein
MTSPRPTPKSPLHAAVAAGVAVVTVAVVVHTYTNHFFSRANIIPSCSPMQYYLTCHISHAAPHHAGRGGARGGGPRGGAAPRSNVNLGDAASFPTLGGK